MQDVAFGQERVRAWPRKRPQLKSADQLENERRFTGAQKAARYIAPQIAQLFLESTADLPLLPRDILTAQIYNRLLSFQLPDGKVLYPMPYKIEVSLALDAISQNPGDVLVRGQTTWEAQPLVPYPRALAHVTRSGTFGVGSGTFHQYPFNSVVQDPNGLWRGDPDYWFEIAHPGLYLFEASVRMTTANLVGMRLRNGTPTNTRALGFDSPGARSVCVVAALQCEAGDTITTSTVIGGAGTMEAPGSGWVYFKCTGPL